MIHMKRSSDAAKPKCLLCDIELGFFRRIAHSRFCSAQHEETYWLQLQDLAIERLRNATTESALPVQVDRAGIKKHLDIEQRAPLPISVAA